ncbi:MAG: sialidase family protein [Thermoplasmatota archaeon]
MKNTKKLAVLLIIPLLLTVLLPIIKEAEGGKPIFSANIYVNWDEWEYNQRAWDMEVDGNGRIYIAYTSTKMYYPDPYLIHSDDGGKTWSSSFRIDDCLRDGNVSNDRSSQNAPKIAIASNNTVYAVWADERDKTYFMPQTRHIRIAWSEDGENFSRSVRIDPVKKEPNWDASLPDIAIGANDRIFVAWQDRKDSGAYNNIWSSYSDDGGVTWSEMQYINDDELWAREHDYVRCVMHENDVYVTWQDRRGDGNQYHPWLAVSLDGGETFGGNIMLSDDNEQYNSRQWPSPALDDSGNLFVTWRDKRTGNDEIWFTRSEDKGQTFSTNMRVSVTPDVSEDWYPNTAAFGDGTLGVVFQRSVPSQQTMDEGEIFYINSSDGGRTWDSLMRVDDTDRYYHDLSLQELPLLTYDNSGRALSTWTDQRNNYGRGWEVYFSSHSGPVDGPNLRPLLYDVEFWGPFEFNRNVGSSSVNITFSCNYSDQNNDIPIEGYPRVHLYKDIGGTEPILETPVVMSKEFVNDIDYMDGSRYLTAFQIPYQGQVYWRIEVVEERDDEPLFSPVMVGPLIDATPPKLTVIEPQEGMWYGSETVFCKVLVEDFEGGNVRSGSIKVRKSVNGLDNLEKGVKLANINMIDNDTYEAWGNIRLNPGQDNYVVYEAMDKVGNGPGLSLPVNIWVDPEPPFYTAIGPREEQVYEGVNCTIQWMDHLPGSITNSSGLNLSSVQYAYRTTSGPSSEWMEPDGFIELPNEVYQYYVNLEFPDEGVYNYIKWRAADNIGNYDETSEFRIKVNVPDNYAPVFVGKAYPKGVVSPTPHFFWDDAFDEEGDRLYYSVMILRHPGDLPLTPWITLGERTFYDVPDQEGLNPGYYVLRVNVTDKLGGYDLLDHIFRIMDKGTPPPQNIPPIGPYYLSNSSGFLFRMNSSVFSYLLFNDMKNLSAVFWENGEQIFEDAVLKLVAPLTYQIRYPEGAPDKGEMYFIILKYDVVNVSFEYGNISYDEARIYFNVYRENVVTWQSSPSSSEMDLDYMVRLGSRTYLGDIHEWTNIGNTTGLPKGMVEGLPIGLYSLQVMVTSQGNYSRVSEGMLKVNDYNLTYEAPGEFKAYRGVGRGFSFDLTNFATYSDNATVKLLGTLADDGWAYLDKSGSREAVFRLETQRLLTEPVPAEVFITIFPDSEVQKGSYNLSIMVQSEDKSDPIYIYNITINIGDKPRESFGEEVSDNIYKFLTDTFPFLKSIRQSLLVPLFLLFVLVVIVIISGAGIYIYRKKFRKSRKEDPYREQREVYKELYGIEPTDEQLKQMKETQGDDFFSDIPDIGTGKEKAETTKFDESFLETEGKKKSKEDVKEPEVKIEEGPLPPEKEEMDDEGGGTEPPESPFDDEGSLDPDRI